MLLYIYVLHMMAQGCWPNMCEQFTHSCYVVYVVVSAGI